ncbi:MAG: hypothetical protein MUC91_10245, partial [Verrucomicrobia bacterium]|nr:hypothetical protein [Verrucomicrobiota bacterium]
NPDRISLVPGLVEAPQQLFETCNLAIRFHSGCRCSRNWVENRRNRGWLTHDSADTPATMKYNAR